MVVGAEGYSSGISQRAYANPRTWLASVLPTSARRHCSGSDEPASRSGTPSFGNAGATAEFLRRTPKKGYGVRWCATARGLVLDPLFFSRVSSDGYSTISRALRGRARRGDTRRRHHRCLFTGDRLTGWRGPRDGCVQCIPHVAHESAHPGLGLLISSSFSMCPETAPARDYSLQWRPRVTPWACRGCQTGCRSLVLRVISNQHCSVRQASSEVLPSARSVPARSY